MRHDSFLVRCWADPGGQPRIEIEHIQTGSRSRVSSYAIAVAWMSAQTARQRGEAEAGPVRVEGESVDAGVVR